MKTNLIFITQLAGVLLLATGCSADNETIGNTDTDLRVVKLTAGYVSNYPAARTSLNADYKILWNTGDVINLNGHTSTSTSITNDGLFALFSFSTATPTYYAFYPASMVSSFDETAHTFAITLPATQAYKNDVSFSDNVNPAVAVSDYEYLGFYNLCGMLRVPITTNTTAVKARFLSADHAVAGAATANPSDKTLTVTGNGMEVDITSLPATGTYTCTWVLPAATYGAGWRIQLLDANDKMVSEKTFSSALNIKRGYMANVTTTHDFPKDESSTVSTEVTDVYLDGGSETTIVSLSGAYSQIAAENVWAPGNLIATPKGDGTFTYTFAASKEFYSGEWNGGDYFCWNTLSPTATNSTNATNTYNASTDPCRLVVSDGIWRMPTHAELTALKNSGSAWETKNGTNGRTFSTTTIPTSGSYWPLFLPAAGYRDKESTNMNQIGENGYYWAATADGTITAYRLFFNNDKTDTDTYNKDYGYAIRCVLDYVTPGSIVEINDWEYGILKDKDTYYSEPSDYAFIN